MSLCITTVVNKAYQRFLASFVYFCFSTYPNYGVKIFLTDGLASNQKDILDELKNRGDLELIEGAFKGFPLSNQELKTLRWVIDPKYFNDYENIYVGDVDMLICRENVDLESQHLEHCRKNDLPYSNSVRSGSKRLSGLHFIRKNEYYNVMAPIVEEYKTLLKRRKLKNSKNEENLYRMIEKSKIGVPNGWFRPHHGIHLGLWRKGCREISQRSWDVIGRDAYKDYYMFYKSIVGLNDPLFTKAASINEIKYMEKSLESEFGKELNSRGL